MFDHFRQLPNALRDMARLLLAAAEAARQQAGDTNLQHQLLAAVRHGGRGRGGGQGGRAMHGGGRRDGQRRQGLGRGVMGREEAVPAAALLMHTEEGWGLGWGGGSTL